MSKKRPVNSKDTVELKRKLALGISGPDIEEHIQWFVIIA